MYHAPWTTHQIEGLEDVGEVGPKLDDVAAQHHLRARETECPPAGHAGEVGRVPHRVASVRGSLGERVGSGEWEWERESEWESNWGVGERVGGESQRRTHTHT